VARTTEDLSSLGVYTFQTLQKRAEAENRTAFQVDRLIKEKSINLLVGNSNLGKTPLAVTLGVAVASGTPFLGLPTQLGRVLYADSEQDSGDFVRLLSQVSKQAGLPAPPPFFEVWSPNWDTANTASAGDALLQRIEKVEPNLVIIDPLRTFFTEAEQKADAAAAAIAALRDRAKRFSTAFIIIHHLRKMAADGPRLATDPYGWIQNVAGSLAIVNGTDSRLGVELAAEDELTLGGFIRGRGTLSPLRLLREYDEDGSPLGYRRLVSLDLLSEPHRAALAKLPDEFRFKDIHEALGKSGGSASAGFVKTAMAAGLVQKTDTGTYRKVDTGAGAGARGALRLIA